MVWQISPVSGRARQAPKLAPDPDSVIRLERSSGGAHLAHMAIMAGKVTPWNRGQTLPNTHTHKCKITFKDKTFFFFYLAKPLHGSQSKEPGGAQLGSKRGEEGEGGCAQNSQTQKQRATVMTRQVTAGDLGAQVPEEEGPQEPALGLGVPGVLRNLRNRNKNRNRQRDDEVTTSTSTPTDMNTLLYLPPGVEGKCPWCCLCLRAEDRRGPPTCSWQMRGRWCSPWQPWPR